MSRIWNFLFGPPPRTPVRPAVPPGGIPRTFVPALGDGVPTYFDPALRHYGRALRAGEPVIERTSLRDHWQALRRLATDHVLRCLAESPAGEVLILRGSRTLKAWLGDAAREPGDLDFVIDGPNATPPDGPMTGLIDPVFARPAPDGIVWRKDAVASDDIWTYERAPGRRLVFPWQASYGPGGAVQVDVVFGETLAEPDTRIGLAAADGGCIGVRAAGPAQALAWKLLWLATDTYPQGKDVYDAVLLAERFPLPEAVLADTCRRANVRPPMSVRFLDGIAGVDWPAFRQEYPHIGGEPHEWQARLRRAIAPTFGDAELPPPASGFPPAWGTPTVRALAGTIRDERAFDRLPILADALEEAGCDRADVLGHLRAAGPHATACWVTDWIG